MEEEKLQEMRDLAQGKIDNGTEPHEEPKEISAYPSRSKESDPYMTRKEVDSLITGRLIQFHDALVERGQIQPIPEKKWD